MEFIQLALDYKPVNLGQGFPDFAAPEHVAKALSEAAIGPNILLNQYTRGFVSMHFSKNSCCLERNVFSFFFCKIYFIQSA